MNHKLTTKNQKLLVIGHTWPEPSTTAAGQHMLQLITAFQDRNYQITFASTAAKTEYSFDLKTIGIEEVPIRLNHASFDVFVENLQPNIVIFDRFMVEEQFGWRVAEHCPNAIRILNTEDLHSLRESREIAHKAGAQFEKSSWLQLDKTKREVASIYRSDLTLLVSTFEMQLLEETIGINKELLLHLPFLLNEIDAKATTQWPSYEARNGFIAFGNGKHAPNVDSFKFLKTTIWPLIRKELPDAKLHLYGAYLPQQIQEMHNPKEGFLVHGWIDDLNTAIQNSRVVLAPLRYGAGIKGKINSAFANGTPAVTTPIGVEGITGTANYSGLAANDSKMIAQKAVALYQQGELWKKAQAEGSTIYNQNFSRHKLEQLLFKRIEQLCNNLAKQRENNFMGSLLQHQTLSTSKFMSKWIEEKNRKK